MFLSCAAEYAVAVWHKDYSEPLLMYDLGSQVRCHWSHYRHVTCDWSILQVGDVAWAPYSSTVFAAVTIDGRAVVFDLSVNKYNPICNQVSSYSLLLIFVF